MQLFGLLTVVGQLARQFGQQGPQLVEFCTTLLLIEEGHDRVELSAQVLETRSDVRSKRGCSVPNEVEADEGVYVCGIG